MFFQGFQAESKQLCVIFKNSLTEVESGKSDVTFLEKFQGRHGKTEYFYWANW